MTNEQQSSSVKQSYYGRNATIHFKFAELLPTQTFRWICISQTRSLVSIYSCNQPNPQRQFRFPSFPDFNLLAIFILSVHHSATLPSILNSIFERPLLFLTSFVTVDSSTSSSFATFVDRNTSQAQTTNINSKYKSFSYFRI